MNARCAHIYADGTLCNARESIHLKLDSIIGVLPSLTAPTIANLYHKEWFSVETVISESNVRELVPKLLKEGAEGIIEYSLNKII